MTESPNTWGLTILAAHSQRWSQQVAREFRDIVSTMIADVEGRMRTEHSSLHLRPLYVGPGSLDSLKADLGVSIGFAIIDVTDYDENLAFLAGQVKGAGVPYVLVCQSESATLARRALNDAEMISYASVTDAFRNDSLLHQRLSQAISHARVLEELVYELWFPRETRTIWVVCPQDHDPGEFADRSSPDYTYLDNLGDTDALLEIMVFLSRYYPKASIQEFSSTDLPRDHTKDNLVVIGGPGSCDDISNHICQEMMSAMNSRISYTPDCETMHVHLEGVEPIELRAELHSDAPEPTRPDHYNIRRDYGYFARFSNPLSEGSTVVLVNGIHTAGVLGAARAFSDCSEALRNYHLIFDSCASPKLFECHFEVKVLHGDVRLPIISLDSVFPLGPVSALSPDSLASIGEGSTAIEKPSRVTVLFVAGDRGGAQRNQLQIPKEYHSIEAALEGSKYRDDFELARPILGATPSRLVAAYRVRPAILHLAGHGDDRSLSLISDQGLVVSTIPIIAEGLVSVLTNFPARVRLCVLNTCASASVAKHLVDAHVVDAAVGWAATLVDSAAIAFSETFYRCLGDGLTLTQSVTLAAQSCGSQDTPSLYTDESVDPNGADFFRRAEQ